MLSFADGSAAGGVSPSMDTPGPPSFALFAKGGNRNSQPCGILTSQADPLIFDDLFCHLLNC